MSATRRGFFLLPLVRALSAVQPGPTYSVELCSRQKFRYAVAGAVLPSGEIAVLDKGTYRVIILSRQGDVVRQIGQIGQEEGSLFEPMALAADRAGHVYVLDAGNQRIQRFAPNGSFLKAFRVDSAGRDKTDSMLVSVSGHILLNAPLRGNLVTAFTPDGKVVGQFGRLLPPSAGYPNQTVDDTLQAALNRGFLAEGPDGSIYVTFEFMPVVLKLDRRGKVIWQKRLENPSSSRIASMFWDPALAKTIRMVKKLDSVQFGVVSTCAALDREGRLHIVIGDNSLLTVSSEGVEETLRLPASAKTPFFVSISSSGPDLYLVCPGQGCYRLLS